MNDKELREAFEKVTTRNVRTVVEFSQKTRALVRELEKRVTRFEEELMIRDKKIQELKNQIVHLQMKVFRGGTS
jgi:peptidoglycan hydrolase CwlO-like protein